MGVKGHGGGAGDNSSEEGEEFVPTQSAPVSDRLRLVNMTC